MTERFSESNDYRPSVAQITVREDAPSELRGAIPILAQDVGMSPEAMRQVVCQVLLKPPDSENWSHSYIFGEVVDLVNGAAWFKVYDITEALYTELTSERYEDIKPAHDFERRLNDFFVENGIGWELRDGKIVHRGSDVFARSTHEVPQLLDETGFERAASEMREAHRDISRRPEPDLTGAIQHAMAALEATAREVTGQPNQTLGSLVSALDLHKPLDQAVHKLWGYASDRGRHIREGQTVDRAEAEFIVTVAGALCDLLASKER